MLVKMSKTTKGQDRDASGIARPVMEYEAGKSYEVSDILAKAFVDVGAVTKDAGAAPENKGAPSAVKKNVRRGSRARNDC